MNKSAAFQRCIYTAEAQRTRNGFFTRRPRRLSGAFSHCRGAEHAEKIFHSAPSASLRCVCFFHQGAERAERIVYPVFSASQRRIFLPQRRRARGTDFLLGVLGVSAVHLHRRVTVLLVKGRSYAQPDPRAFADAILRRE